MSDAEAHLEHRACLGLAGVCMYCYQEQRNAIQLRRLDQRLSDGARGDQLVLEGAARPVVTEGDANA